LKHDGSNLFFKKNIKVVEHLEVDLKFMWQQFLQNHVTFFKKLQNIYRLLGVIER
jgi:hypothetical protein